MAIRIVGWAMACIFLIGCGNSGVTVAAEPLIGWDGETLSSGDGTAHESGPSSLPLASDPLIDNTAVEVPSSSVPEPIQVEERGGWINPDFVFQAKAGGTRMIDFGRLRPYTVTPDPETFGCAPLATFIAGEQLATIDAVMLRGTSGVTAETAGADGTLMQAHAISYSDPIQVPDLAEASARVFLDCANEGDSTTAVPLAIEGGESVDVLYVEQALASDMRIVIQHRANIIVTIFAWVDNDDEAIFEEFVSNTGRLLASAVSEEEILPEDLR